MVGSEVSAYENDAKQLVAILELNNLPWTTCSPMCLVAEADMKLPPICVYTTSYH